MKRVAIILLMACVTLSSAFAEPKRERAILAGGCFWCLQPPFDKEPGVISTRVGYAGGEEVNPTYKQVSSGKTGHKEAVEVIFDPGIISYEKILEIFWANIDPTDPGGQFVDRGPQYRTAIFPIDEEQRKIAEESKSALSKSGRHKMPIVTEIQMNAIFYPAEEYHQDYYKKESENYYRYKKGSGRDAYFGKSK